ncbi:MAG: GPR endopeptidase [Oscillospiraceae bacterium]|nr:GPR endopeptidase [Oscillospiraceae bacterium]MBR4093729.1 GPR endopeptidase [Oscillospiraceae bacterium]
MLLIRTDLAEEKIPETNKVPEGISKEEKTKGNCRIITVDILSDKASEEIGKPKGRYITIRFNDINPENFENTAEYISEEISSLIPDGKALIACLGNRNITPDAIGPLASEKIIATRHISDELPELKEFSSLRQVSVITMGVLGQTGIESAEIVKAVANDTKPDFVVVIDALACSDTERLCRTIQISTTGISPGSGVQNSRKELSEKTLGIPVIAIGIPTVVDMHTIAENLTNSPPDENKENMMVTPRDIDKLVERASKLIAFSLNRSLFSEFSFKELEMLSS